ncbi:MAG: alpha-amylase family glycosyl hydrolase [Egibacteraceae bacterium]
MTGVVYQIYPRSFLDTDGDGIGDLEGIRRRLDYLAWLGVDALWLSPIYPSPMADFGYDVADHRDVDPVFGSLDDFDRLLEEAHARGLRVLLDWVANHTSDRHPWFLNSRSARDSEKRDWYVWRDAPNNWTAAFADERAWTYDAHTGQYYLHLFLPQQPDLNWEDPRVEAAMHDVLRFWLDRGVDGFRADVIHLIGKDPDLPDDPPHLVGTSRVGRHDTARTHELLRRIRSVLDGYGDDRVMVGEVNLTEHARIVRYYGAGDQLHLAFNFVPLHAPWDAGVWAATVEEITRQYDAAGAWPTWVLSNHDQPRHRSRLGTEARARAAAVLLLTLRGTPFLYAGEELGLEDAVVPPERIVDPGGRDGCRAPIPWQEGPSPGWATADPWLPWPPDATPRCAARQRQDPTSMLHLYRRLLRLRGSSAALRAGTLELLDSPTGVLTYRRASGDDERIVAVNFTSDTRHIPHAGRVVDVASDGAGETVAFDGVLSPNQGVVLGR